MTPSNTASADPVASQAARIPSIYGRVDFSVTPERFTVDPSDVSELDGPFAKRRAELLASTEQVARVRTYTMTGDAVADAYAALIPQHGFKRLVSMLVQACDQGVGAVPGAPPELGRFIAEMERLPTWLAPALVAEGARIERNSYAHRAPFVLRGAILGTFMNKYAALPMALTGALSHQSAGHRIKETATFFTSIVMPDALDRHGMAFKSAAMVRLMHSMVRFNLMHGGRRWDTATYGIPIPQIDQLPAGLLSVGSMAIEAFGRGRAFTPAERARVELARYRCFLLGLPADLLATTPEGIATLLLTRQATLRKGFDETCASLVRATMEADLTTGRGLRDRMLAWMEEGFARVVVAPRSLREDKDAATLVQVRWPDYVAAAATGAFIAVRMAGYAAAARLPGLGEAVDRALVRKLEKQLASYGHAEFTTNAETYRTAHAHPHA